MGDGRFKSGDEWTGNAAGRPRGIKNRATILREKIEQFGPELMDIITRAARGDGELPPDMTAALALLARLEPPVRATAPKVRFDLDKTLPLHEQAQQILDAIAEGEIDPDTGQALIATLDKIGNLKAVEQLEARLVALESKAQG